MNTKNFFTKRSIALLILLAIAVVIVIFCPRRNDISQNKQGIIGYKDAEYIIGGLPVQLVNGVSEVEIAPGSASKITTRYFGNEVVTDLNNDGREDVVFLLTQEMGGSGVFYYVVAALNTETGYIGSEGLLLGDRIAPQTTSKGNGNIVVINYADRAAGDDFSVEPSVGKSIWLLLDPETMQFGEVAQNFEGEANPAMMSLTMKTWVWVSAQYADGRITTPKASKKFTITFDAKGNFSAATDCNGIGGRYVVAGQKIVFSEMISTQMYCEGSQETEFASLLSDAETYSFTSRGELILNLKSTKDKAVFQ